MTGVIEQGKAGAIAFAQGIMNVGEAMATPVIRGVEACCAAEDIPILMRIPFDRRIAEAYSEGVPLLEALLEYREQFARLYRQIQQMGTDVI